MINCRKEKKHMYKNRISRRKRCEQSVCAKLRFRVFLRAYLSTYNIGCCRCTLAQKRVPQTSQTWLENYAALKEKRNKYPLQFTIFR